MTRSGDPGSGRDRPTPDAVEDRRWNDRLTGAISAVLAILVLVAGLIVAARWLLGP